MQILIDCFLFLLGICHTAIFPMSIALRNADCVVEEAQVHVGHLLLLDLHTIDITLDCCASSVPLPYEIT